MNTFAGVTVEVIHSAKRRKSITIQVEPNRIVVRAPLHVGSREVDDVLARRRDWIERTLAGLQSNPAPAPDGSLPTQLLFQGMPLTVQLAPSSVQRFRAERHGDSLVVTGPTVDEGSPEVRRAMLAWYRQAAHGVLLPRLAWWSRHLGLPYKQARIKAQKTRWGSCSTRGNINLNWRLVQAPPFVADYVIVHELCHLKEMNHSARFWALVSQALPDYERAKAWLKKNGSKLLF